MTTLSSPLDEQRAEFIRRRFTTMPIAGAIGWALVGLGGLWFETLFARSMTVFACTGSIFYIALLVDRFTREDILGRNRPKNEFDRFFMLGVAQAVAVYSIAIPFFLIDRTSLPLTVGILTGLMWIPFSGFLNHWVGYFHCGLRTVGILITWYAFPNDRFVAIPCVIVVVYLLTIAVLRRRFILVNKPLQNSENS